MMRKLLMLFLAIEFRAKTWVPVTGSSRVETVGDWWACGYRYADAGGLCVREGSASLAHLFEGEAVVLRSEVNPACVTGALKELGLLPANGSVEIGLRSK